MSQERCETANIFRKSSANFQWDISPRASGPKGWHKMRKKNLTDLFSLAMDTSGWLYTSGQVGISVNEFATIQVLKSLSNSSYLPIFTPNTVNILFLKKNQRNVYFSFIFLIVEFTPNIKFANLLTFIWRLTYQLKHSELNYSFQNRAYFTTVYMWRSMQKILTYEEAEKLHQ